LLVLHRCDNPSCVNPRHLFLGTHADNMLDMVNKGRAARITGEKNGNSKLTAESVQRIRERLTDGNSLNRVAREFDVSKRTVLDIKSRRTWASVN
jgi:DNA invertase Pin-like site-specific DNA recombinase